MSADKEPNKPQHKAEELMGKAKETFGKVTGDKPDQGEGKTQQSIAKLKRIGDKVRSTLGR